MVTLSFIIKDSIALSPMLSRQFKKKISVDIFYKACEQLLLITLPWLEYLAPCQPVDNTPLTLFLYIFCQNILPISFFVKIGVTIINILL